MITEKIRAKKIDKGTEFAGEFKKLCKVEGIQINSTMSETMAAFAERTTRSLKNILSRYMEGNGYKYFHKLTQFVTTLNSRRNCLMDLIPKNVRTSDFLFILYSKPLLEFRKPKFKVGDRICISKTYPVGRVIRHSIHNKCSRVLYFFPENLQHTQKRMNKMRLSAVNFIRKSWSKSFKKGNVYKRVGFKCICATFSRQYTELFY